MNDLKVLMYESLIFAIAIDDELLDFDALVGIDLYMYTRDSYLGKRACISVSRWKPVSFSITTCPWCFGSRFRIAVIQSQPLLDRTCFSCSCVRYTWNPCHDGFECQNLLFIHSASGFGFTVHTWLVLQRLRYWPLTKARFYLAHISVVPESLEWCI